MVVHTSEVFFQIESKQNPQENSLMDQIILTDQTKSAKLSVVAFR